LENFEKSNKKEKGSCQGESQTEKQWHTRREAYSLRCEQHANCMKN